MKRCFYFYNWCVEQGIFAESSFKMTESLFEVRGTLNQSAPLTRLLKIERLPEHEAKWYSNTNAVYSVRPRDNKSVVANGGFIKVGTEIVFISTEERI